MIFDLKKQPVILYCPIHLDKIGRMYQYGILNIVGSKFLRCILEPRKPKKALSPDTSHSSDILTD